MDTTETRDEESLNGHNDRPTIDVVLAGAIDGHIEIKICSMQHPGDKDWQRLLTKSRLNLEDCIRELKGGST